MDFSCLSCNSEWTRGDFSETCEECGGGAMERACIVCLGECKNTWKRAPLDSQDSHEAHWIGGCALPRERQMEIMRRRAAEELERPE